MRASPLTKRLQKAMDRLRRHASYANVMSTFAVFAVLGGGAWAAAKIGTDDIEKGAVTTKKLHKAAVTTKKIGADAVTGAKLDESSLGSVPLAANAGTASRALIGMSPLAYARVTADGTVDAENSRGVTNANVANDLGRAGTYCITGLTGVKSAIVVADTPLTDYDQGPPVAQVHLRGDFPDTPACTGAKFMVSTARVGWAGGTAPGAEPEDASFFIWFFG
jgi:hypothetical protein